ncbi:MAG: TIGR03118 family protein [Verrucomicrobia bacterium]|nr:TIGR03118 family protein [Verrucomicrobiota bacterium]
MKNIGDIDPGLLARRTLRVGSMLVLFLPAALSAQQYQRTDLVSDTIVEGTNPNDPQLKNPWGITRGTNSDWWVSDEMAGVSTLYNGIGAKNKLVVTIPHSPQTTIGSPTGIVVNGSSDFEVAPGSPAAFIFASFDGTISGWNPGVNLNNAIPKVPGSSESILTGATIALVEDQRFLYVADIRAGKVTVYGTDFKPVKLREDAFDDDYIPRGFVPFNVQNIGGNLYVAYAKQNQTKTFVDFGAGLGFVDVFSPRGRLLQRLEHGDWFNAPWGLTLAPSDFGTFSHKVIVGQFGSGEVLAFDAVTGRFEGKFKDPNDNVIAIDGLWALGFGSGVASSDPPNVPNNEMFFTAGPNFGNDGLFGTFTPVKAELIQGSAQ